LPFRSLMIFLIGGFTKNSMTDTHYMSQEKLDELIQELQERKTAGRKEIAVTLEYAKSLGDLSENFEYHDAKDRQATNEKRIIILEDMIKNAVIIQQQSGGSVIDLGVTFLVERDQKEMTFQIVGSNEANPLEGKISNESPMGEAFIGARVGEVVVVETPAGHAQYTVKAIH